MADSLEYERLLGAWQNEERELAELTRARDRGDALRMEISAEGGSSAPQWLAAKMTATFGKAGFSGLLDVVIVRQERAVAAARAEFESLAVSRAMADAQRRRPTEPEVAISEEEIMP